MLCLIHVLISNGRFSTDELFAHIHPKARGRLFAQHSQQLFDIRDVSLITIQACILLGAYAVTEGEAETESVYYSVASRMARLLDLPNMLVSTELEREINIRGEKVQVILENS